MSREPLWDLAGRTLCLGYEVSNTIEGLLRLQNTADHQRPITLYIVGTPSITPPLPTDILMLCSLIRSLRSPTVTIGMGVLNSALALILAAGTHRRYLLRHSLISLAPQKWDMAGLARAPIGLGISRHQRTPQEALEAQAHALLAELKLDASLFQSERLLTAEEAVQNQLADAVVAHTLPQVIPIPSLLHETKR